MRKAAIVMLYTFCALFALGSILNIGKTKSVSELLVYYGMALLFTLFPIAVTIIEKRKMFEPIIINETNFAWYNKLFKKRAVFYGFAFVSCLQICALPSYIYQLDVRIVSMIIPIGFLHFYFRTFFRKKGAA